MTERAEHMPGLNAQRDGYIEGVPCWVDASEPDPEAAAEFYGGLFGWELEDEMPPDAPGEDFMARLRGLNVAAVGPIPGRAPPTAKHYAHFWFDSSEDRGAEDRDA